MRPKLHSGWGRKGWLKNRTHVRTGPKPVAVNHPASIFPSLAAVLGASFEMVAVYSDERIQNPLPSHWASWFWLFLRRWRRCDCLHESSPAVSGGYCSLTDWPTLQETGLQSREACTWSHDINMLKGMLFTMILAASTASSWKYWHVFPLLLWSSFSSTHWMLIVVFICFHFFIPIWEVKKKQQQQNTLLKRAFSR